MKVKAGDLQFALSDNDLGQRLAHRLARDFRKKFSVVIEGLLVSWQVRRAVSVMSLIHLKQEICCSRMFGKRLTEIAPINEAVPTSARWGGRSDESQI